MSIAATNEPRPLLPLVLLHTAAAGICFAFFTIVPIVACVAVMKFDNDPGGPMFFPMFVMGVVILASIATAFIATAVLLMELLRLRFTVPFYLLPLAVLLCATGLAFACLLNSRVSPVFSPVVGIAVTMAFVIHWASISAAWVLLNKLFSRTNPTEMIEASLSGTRAEIGMQEEYRIRKTQWKNQ